MSLIVLRARVALSLVALALCLNASAAYAELTVNDFRGSSLTYSNMVSVNSLDQSAEPTYNPYYDMLLTLAPRYWFLPRTFVSASLSIDREFTEPDDTTYKNETRLSDLNLRVGSILHSWDFGLTTFGAVGVTLPTSLASQARTTQLATNGLIALTQALGKIGSLSYAFGLTHTAFEYTTGELESPRISSCAGSAVGCDPFLNTGVRNTPWRTVHNLSLNLFPKPWLFVSASAGIITSYLYPALNTDPRVSNVPQEPTNKRAAMSYGLEVDLQPKQWLIFALALNTFNPQLAPNSTNYAPFFNRFTVASFDVRFTLGVFRVAQTSSDNSAQAPKKLEKKKKKQEG